MDAIETMRSARRKALERGGSDLRFMLWVKEPLALLERQAFQAEVELIRRWNYKRFYAVLKAIANSL